MKGRSNRITLLTCALAFPVLTACERADDAARPTDDHPARASTRADAAPAPPVSPQVVPDAPARVIAIGDVHGDIEALRGALRLAGLVDREDRWTGESAVLVQTGDLLDRGDDEQEIIELLDRLGVEASAAGGAIVELLGNHEVMNVAGDWRYVTPGGLADFADAPGVDPERADLPGSIPGAYRARAAALLPGKPWAARLARHDVVRKVGDSIFAHGGVLPEHLAYGLDRLNAETRAWMRGDGPLPAVMQGERSPIWSRDFSAPAEIDCALLARALDAAKAKRLVVGHTVQPSGITEACDGKVWRIDVGMARHYGNAPAALEITSEGARALTGR